MEQRQGSRWKRFARSCVLAVSVLLVGYLVGVGAATLAGRTGILGAPAAPAAQGEVAPEASAGEDSPQGLDVTDSFVSPHVAFTPWDEQEAPNYYRVIGSAQLGDAPAVGTVAYGELDELGRATGAESLITYESMQAGRARSRGDLSALAPSGWGHNGEVDMAMPDGSVYHGQIFNRSHLLAKSLGGDDELHNLVTATRTQNVGANVGGSEGGMAYAEGLARMWLERNPEGTVHFRAVPAYAGDELVARSVIVDVRSSDGSIDQRIEVFNAALGFEIDYATGTYSVTGDAGQLAQGLRATPVSGEADDSGDDAEPSSTSVVPTGSPESADGERKVIVTRSGAAYHHDETCKGLVNARSMEWVSVSEAESMGRHPCGICGG